MMPQGEGPLSRVANQTGELTGLIAITAWHSLSGSLTPCCRQVLHAPVSHHGQDPGPTGPRHQAVLWVPICQVGALGLASAGVASNDQGPPVASLLDGLVELKFVARTASG